jgi:NAD(P)-dependent dehydrogenase (short-subunit alcohol dehydrogenase family)
MTSENKIDAQQYRTSPRTVLITGCSSGFGRQAVTLFLEKGWHVIATLREAEKRRSLFAQELERWGDHLTLLSLDVSSSQEIQKVAQEVMHRFNARLDCLINNAGFGLFGALEDVEQVELRYQMEVNFFGVSSLIQVLLPALRNSKGKIINVSSVLGYVGMPFTSAYCASKYALEGLTESLYFELKPFGVQVSLVEPGAHQTDFNKAAQWGKRSFLQNSPYIKSSLGYRSFREKSSARLVLASSDSVAQTLVRLSEKTTMPLRVRCGKDANLVFWLKRIIPERLFLTLLSTVFNKILARQTSR